MNSIHTFIGILLYLFVVVTPNSVLASPPLLSDLVIEPTILTLGSGPQTINISVTATDPDGDLDSEKTKVTVKFDDKSKVKTTLVDAGGGNFTGQVEIDTTTGQTLSVKIKAKDVEKEKAEKLTTTIVITDAAETPTAIVSDQTEWEGDSGEIIVLRTRVVSQVAPEVGVPNWPVTFSVDAGDGTIVQTADAGSIREDDETNPRLPEQVTSDTRLQSITVVTDASGFALIDFEIGDASLSTVQAIADGILAPIRFSIQSFGIPTGIALNADGDVFVLDGALRTIVKIDPDTRQGTIASGCQSLTCDLQVGAGPRLSLPMAMTIEDDGSLVVADRRLSALVRVDTSTGERTIIAGCIDEECTARRGEGPSIDSSTGIELSIAANQSIVATDFERVIRVDEITGDRTVITGCVDAGCTDVVGNGPVFEHPQAIATDVDGAFIVIYDRPAIQSVVRVDPETGNRTVISGCLDATCSTRIGEGPPFAGRRSIAIGPSGELMVTDTRRRGMISIDPQTGNRAVVTGCLDGECIEQAGTGQALGFPTSLTFRENGSIIVADQSRGDILLVNTSTGNRNAFFGLRHGGPPLSRPSGIAQVGTQTFVVADADFGSLIQVDARTGDRTKISGCRDFRCTEQIGDGPPLSAPIAITINAEQQLLVLDESLDAVIQVDSQFGDRRIISGCRGSPCSTQTGNGPQMDTPTAITTGQAGTLFVATRGVNAAFAIDPATGDRTIISGCVDSDCVQRIGTGPLFSHPISMAQGQRNTLFILDAGMDALIRVEVLTGDRTVVADVRDPRAVTIALDGTPFVADARGLFRVDQETGRTTTISDRETGRGVPFLSLTDIVAQSNDMLIVTDQVLRAVLSVDPDAGRRTIVSR